MQASFRPTASPHHTAGSLIVDGRFIATMSPADGAMLVAAFNKARADVLPTLVYVASYDVKNGGTGVEVFATQEFAVDAVIGWAEERLTGAHGDMKITHESAEGASVEQARTFLAEHGHLMFGSADCYYHVTTEIVRGSAPLLALADAVPNV